jgi:hypothetical protein
VDLRGGHGETQVLRQRSYSAADGFLTLFSHKAVLPGIVDPAKLKEVSAAAGEVDVRLSSVTRGGWPRQSSTTRPLRREPGSRWTQLPSVEPALLC